MSMFHGPLTIPLPDGREVSALLDAPQQPWAGCVFAHGAGAGMQHAFMGAMAIGLAARGIAVLRYQFPFMQQGSRRPDTPSTAHATVRSAIAAATAAWPGLPLFAAGKSYGGRMSSQAQAAQPLPGVRGIAFAGFPLHPADKPSTTRADHLAQVQLPMLFLQGTRDALASLPLMREVIAALGKPATLHVVEGADHAFHVLVRSGRTNEQVLTELLDTLAAWMDHNR